MRRAPLLLALLRKHIGIVRFVAVVDEWAG